MTAFNNIRLDFKTAVDVPQWAFRFYIKHILLIAGISAVPSIERFLILYFEPGWSDFWLIALEVLVESLRIVLLWLIVRLAIGKAEQLKGIDRKERWIRVKAFLKHRWLNIVFQLLLMMVATLLFDVFLEQVIGTFVPETARNRYLALLLAIKNPTVIAWFMVWLVGIPRQLFLYSVEASRTGKYIPMD